MGERDTDLLRIAAWMQTHLRTSEYEIAKALAESRDRLTVDELVEETDYTRRTVRKRVDTLAEALSDQPILHRSDAGLKLHPKIAHAILQFESMAVAA